MIAMIAIEQTKMDAVPVIVPVIETAVETAAETVAVTEMPMAMRT
jgi:hypothetical protein